ncbi:MAG: hypothetical protein ACR2P4_08610 [Gammaproteobacteria bacterium]
MMTSALCALRVLPFAAASPPFALSRKWTNGKEMDSRFRGNDEEGGNDKIPSFPRKRESKRARKGALAGLCALCALFSCRAFARAGLLAAFADNGIMQRSKPCAVRRAPCAVQ